MKLPVELMKHAADVNVERISRMAKEYASIARAQWKQRLPTATEVMLDSMAQLMESAFVAGASAGVSCGIQMRNVISELNDGFRAAGHEPPVDMVVTDHDIRVFREREASINKDAHCVWLADVALGNRESHDGWSRELARERVEQMVISRRVVTAIGA